MDIYFKDSNHIENPQDLSNLDKIGEDQVYYAEIQNTKGKYMQNVKEVP